jgi:hypothetical protein
LGGQIRCRVKEREGDEWGPGNWGAETYIGITTRSDISAAALGTRLCVVSKDNAGSDGQSSGVMYSLLNKPGGSWQPGHPPNLVTSGSPGIIAVGDRFHLYYRHNMGNAIYHAWSFDGKEWRDQDQNTLHDSMIGGVCPVLFHDKLWLFYPYLNTTGLAGGYYGDEIMIQTQMPDLQVDLSDHYPLLVDMEMKTRSSLLNVMVHLQDIGDVTFSDGQWAGSRGEARQIEGFQLNPGVPGLTLRYMAHLHDVGDTGWVREGRYIGTRGQAKAVEGFAIQLTGAAASHYHLSYRAHLQDTEDTPFVKDGEFCGTRGQNRRVEAIWIKLQRK